MKARLVLASGVVALAAFFPAYSQDATFPVVTIYASDPVASETGPTSGSFTVLRRGPTNFPLTVFFALSGTASNGVDYEKVGNTVLIPAGETNALIKVTPKDDDLVEGRETVVAHLVGSPLACATCGYDIGTPGEALVVIVDNDGPVNTNPPPVVNLVATDDTGSEIPLVPPWLDILQRFDPAIFTVSRSDGTNLPLTVLYHVGGTAENGVDYEPLSGRVTIPPGAWSADIVVAPIDDFIIEGTETVVISLLPAPCPGPTVGSVGACYTLGPSNEARAVILDNDTESNLPPVVTIVATDPEAAEAGNDPGTMTVSRTGPADVAMTVFYRVEGTARNGLDYRTISNYVVIPAGAKSADITITPIDDLLVEGPETVLVQLAPMLFLRPAVGMIDPPYPLIWPPYLIGTPSNAVVTIADDDLNATNPLPVVSIVARDPIASEGTNFWRLSSVDALWLDGWRLWGVNQGGTNTATFVVRRTDRIKEDLTVYYSVGGTASNGVDYAELLGSVVIPAGQHEARVVVIPIEDKIVEGLETVVLSLVPAPDATTQPSYRIGFPARAAAVIIDNDRSRPPCVLLPDRLFHVCLARTNGFCFRLEASVNLIDWTPVCTNVVTDGALHFIDPDAAGLPQRFYRALPEPGLAPDP